MHFGFLKAAARNYRLCKYTTCLTRNEIMDVRLVKNIIDKQFKQKLEIERDKQADDTRTTSIRTWSIFRDLTST